MTRTVNDQGIKSNINGERLEFSPLSKSFQNKMRFSLTAIGFLAVAACGGGGGGGGGPGNPPEGTWATGVFQSANQFAAQCAVPRTGTDSSGDPYPDVQGTTLAENNFLRSWSNDLYLWYSEIVDRDPGQYTTEEYFELLKTDALTPSGNPKDNFHFSIPTDEYIAQSQSGQSAGYGMEFQLEQNPGSRTVTIVLTEPNSPADNVNISRGATINAIDGVSINSNTQSGIDTLNAGLFPSQVGESHQFTITDLGSSVSRNVTMVSANVVTEPVQNVFSTTSTNGVLTGYILFTTHIATAETALLDAITQLSNDGVNDLVLDLRYNGGGFLDIASQLSYMIAGAQSQGETFFSLVFNDKHQTTNPVTGQPLIPQEFVNRTLGFSTTAGQTLPTLNLNRVFILTGPDTCSASEAIINGLRGINVEVIQIGGTTCGKPYGFYAQDNCGTTYFSIQFSGENDVGFGEYSDGFSPSNHIGEGVPVTGCAVADDLNNALGDPNEALFAAALNYDLAGCPTPSGSGFSKDNGIPQGKISSENLTPLTPRNSWQDNNIILQR